MVRVGQYLILCAVLGWCLLEDASRAAPPSPVNSPLDEGIDKKKLRLLAVQAALEKGLEHLQRGKYEAAVEVLEGRISYIDGNREYLNALRDAYRGYLLQLKRTGRHDKIPTYIRRLGILDPSAPTKVEQISPGGPTGGTRAARANPGQPIPGRASDVHRSTPPTHTPAAPGTASVRSGPEVSDPFAVSNCDRSSLAHNLLSQARMMFRQKHYLAAGRLYDHAHQLSPDVVQSCSDQWAYCKLYRVAHALNSPVDSALTPHDMEKEVQRALNLSSKLESFGQKLLRRIHGAGQRKIAVHHDRPKGGWSVARTTNFHIFHHLRREDAERIARRAEKARLEMAQKWFGKELPTWNPVCALYLHRDAEAYTRATKAPRSSPGHSTFQFENGKVYERRIDLRCDDLHMIDSVLPHETTHVVLAGQFGNHQVPRWADEGMAVLSEPPKRIDRYLRTLPRMRADGLLFRVEYLTRTKNYPDARHISAFYAQSVSVVSFLSGLKGPRVFARFLRDGLEIGYQRAMQRHYGYRTFAELERRWVQHAFEEERGKGVASR